MAKKLAKPAIPEVIQRTVVSGILFNHEGKALIIRRTKGIDRGRMWEVPGGKIDFFEHPHEELAKEFNEEIKHKIEVSDERPVHVDHYTTPRADHRVCMYYLVKSKKGELKKVKLDPKTHDKHAWISREELENLKKKSKYGNFHEPARLALLKAFELYENSRA